MSDFSKIAFSSAYRYERVVAKGSTAITTGASLRTMTIAHNLGYKPYFKAWYTFSSGKYFQLFAGTTSYNIDGNDEQVEDVYVDNTNLYVTLFDTTFGAGHSGTIYYRFYAEKLS
jgi:hypothetical protein